MRSSSKNGKRQRREVLALLAATTGLVLAIAQPIYALNVYSPDNGAYVFDTINRTQLNVTDSACDGYWVYGNYNNNDNNRLNNKSGCHTNAPPNQTSAFKA